MNAVITLMPVVSESVWELLNGSSKLTGFEATATQVVAVFGKPNWGASADDKVDCEWIIELATETRSHMLTVYAYKQDVFGGGKLHFSIGGKNRLAADILKEYIEGKIK